MKLIDRVDMTGVLGVVNEASSPVSQRTLSYVVEQVRQARRTCKIGSGIAVKVATELEIDRADKIGSGLYCSLYRQEFIRLVCKVKLIR